MKTYEIILLVIFAVYCLFLLYFISKTEKPLRYFAIKSAASLILIAVINLTTFASGLHIPVNYCTIIGTLTGGVPFLGGILAINRIFLL